MLWAILTIIGELLAVFVDFYPLARSDKGEDIEHAFRVLIYMAVPVFTFVVSVLVYSVLRSSTSEFPGEDGPPIRGRGAAPVAWLAVTGGLALVTIIYPGITGINDLFFEDEETDLVVEVEAVQWAWIFRYPEQDISTINELVLPLDRNVTFEITSTDVLHSFWIPSFLMKIDAVPGKTTEITLRPTSAGSFTTDPLMRVQCAELCGLAHAKMIALVTVMEAGEFDLWAAEEAAGSAAEPTPDPDAQRIEITGKDSLFDLDEITVEPGSQVVVVFDNQDEVVPHNWALYDSRDAAESGGAPIAFSPIEPGPTVQEIPFDPPDPGTYFFRCDVHPTTMTGELTVQ
ncbi:MAG: cytochrome c oxidase subunit II [Chloroflexota bacterium]